MRIARTLALLLVSAAVGTSAHAQQMSDEARNDAQCLTFFVVSLSRFDEFFANADPANVPVIREGLARGIGLHLGRLQGRDPDIDWFNYLAEHPEVISSIAEPGVPERCVATLQEMGQGMIALGDHLDSQGL